MSIMLMCIMRFLDREPETRRLSRLMRSSEGGLAVVHGRRRIGKTRMLVEWCEAHGGVYFVADESSPEVQRAYFSEAVALRLPGFSAVRYPDWRSLFDRLAADAEGQGFRGPVVIDELPYLVAASPELPSVLQRWMDHAAKRARLVVALAGSSQRTMQGLVLDRSAPLFGRATELFEVLPLQPRYLREAFGRVPVQELLDAWCAWGGVPRYWELATDVGGRTRQVVDALVLDARGVLHDEPARLLLEETPPALEVRPVLDAIGAGAHRVSEIAGRAGRPATALARPLERLRAMALVSRDVPFGSNERETKRSLYRIADPFFRLWFRVVAPHRGALRLAAAPRERRVLFDRHWPSLRAEAWEQLCREQVPSIPRRVLGAGEWRPGQRFWHGNLPEWDIVSEDEAGKRLLLGEARAHGRRVGRSQLVSEANRLAERPRPDLGGRYAGHEIVRVLFVPEVEPRAPRNLEGVRVVTLDDLLS